jgi:AtzE family amidohydrolase
MRLDTTTSALGIAKAVADGEATATAVVEATLARITARDGVINAFTTVTAERARSEAAEIDARRARGESLPPLAGVPYAVKNLFDVHGLTTIAGSRLHERRPPATHDAVLVQRMRAAGAVLVGALNMDAYAYGFTTENTGYGAVRNPHDIARTAGGSSGGSAAAIAAGMVPLTLGSDTNGSIRVPSSLCGIYGLKPTYGRLSRTGSFPFVASLDHLGPFATSVSDLAACYDALQGTDCSDPACAQRPLEAVSHRLSEASDRPLRVARLGGYFDHWACRQAREVSVRAAEALGGRAVIELPEVARARAAAFVISASEGGALHRLTLQRDYDGFEPHNRDRFLAGSLTPASWYVQAQKVRAWFLERVLTVFAEVDVLVAPAAPVPATPLGEDWLELGGERLPLRPSLGIFTQPISCIGLPVAAVPVIGPGLPLGVQLIAPPWREDLCLRAAAQLERAGVARCVIAGG